MPRPYKMEGRRAASDQTRTRILQSARRILLTEKFNEFSIDAVARDADVARFTVYYQFKSKAGLLDALYEWLVNTGALQQLPDILEHGNDPLQHLQGFIEVFVQFWSSERDLVRRLRALGGIDAELGRGLRARSESRRDVLREILEHYSRNYRTLSPIQMLITLDELHMLTSFETFDALARDGRSANDVYLMIRKMAETAIGFLPRSHPVAPPTLNLRPKRRR